MHDSRRIPARRDGGNRAIGPIGYVVKRRHIDAFDLRGAPQKRLLGCALALAGFVQVDQLEVDLLTLAQDKQIDEIGDRLGPQRAERNPDGPLNAPLAPRDRAC